MPAPEDLRAETFTALQEAMYDIAVPMVVESDAFETEYSGIRQRVEVGPLRSTDDFHSYVVQGETELLEPLRPEFDGLERALNQMATLSAVTRTEDDTLRWHTSMLFHQESASWALDTLVAGLSLQKGEALNIQACLHDPARGLPTRPRKGRPDLDGLLSGAVPMLADACGNRGWLTTSDESGLTTEIPFGEDTSLYQVLAQHHPTCGPGVLFLAHCPVGLASGDLLEKVVDRAATHLNEAMREELHTREYIPAVGAWVPNEKLQSVSLNAFLPAGMACPSAVFNLGLLFAARAKRLGQTYGAEIAGEGPSKPALARFLPKFILGQDWWARMGGKPGERS